MLIIVSVNGEHRWNIDTDKFEKLGDECYVEMVPEEPGLPTFRLDFRESPG